MDEWDQYKVSATPASSPVSTGIEADVIASANKHGVDPHLARAMAKNESGFKPGAVSGKGAQGVMQLMPGTAKDMGVTDPLDPTQSIEGGVKYLRQLQDKYPGDFAKQAQAYHQGPGAVDRGLAPGPETSKYVARVMKDREAFAGAAEWDQYKVPAPQPTTPATSQMQSTPAANRQTSYVKPMYKPVIVPPGLQGPPSQTVDSNVRVGGKPANLDQMQAGMDPAGYIGRRYYTDPIISDIQSGAQNVQSKDMDTKLHGAHQLGSGVLRAAAPFAIPAVVAAPVTSAVTAGVSYGAQRGAENIAEKSGAKPGASEVIGDTAGLLAGAGTAAIPRVARAITSTPGMGRVLGGVGEMGMGVYHALSGNPFTGWAAGARGVADIRAGFAAKAAAKVLEEKAAAKAAAVTAKSQVVPEVKPYSRTEVAAKELARQSVAKQTQPTTEIPGRDTGISPAQSTASATNPEYIPPARSSVASPRDTSGMQKILSKQEMPTSEIPPRDTGILPGESAPEATNPEFIPPHQALPVKGREGMRQTVNVQNQPELGSPAYQESWPDYGDPNPAAIGTVPSLPPPVIEPKIVKHIPVRPNPRIAAITNAAQDFKKAVTGKGGVGVETIKSTQPSAQQIARANKLAAGHNKYLSKFTGGKITAADVYDMKPDMTDQLEAQIAAAKAGQLEGQPDAIPKLAKGGIVAPIPKRSKPGRMSSRGNWYGPPGSTPYQAGRHG